MTCNPKLNDFQLILLSTAAQRDDGSVFPVAASILKEEVRIRKAIEPLLKRSLLEELPIKDRRIAWRKEVDQSIGLFITAVGRSVIGQAVDGAQSVSDDAWAKTKKDGAEPVFKVNKTEVVLGLLRRPEGATLSELIDATGWLPHTTRAALTGLRKKGHIVGKSKREDATCYRIAEAA